MQALLQRGSAAVVALLFMSQWVVVETLGIHSPVIVALSAGGAIFGAAFALSWAAEAAQLDIPASLAIVFIALLAVLPEYAVDVYFAWRAGQDPTYTQYATANMTGANRILIGVGWPAVVFAYAWKSGRDSIEIAQGESIELFYLLAATAYSFVIPLKGTISILDTLVLGGIFLAYVVTAMRETVEEPELEGVAELIATFPPMWRRLIVVTLFALAGASIFTAAEPFAEALLEIGREFGVEEFVLVQWLAPLASETPEFVVAILFALRLKADVGFGALLSSKVNQWTLLIGMLPVAYSISHGAVAPMVLDQRQAHEILLTSAQSLFAVVVISDLHFRRSEAIVLLVLFTLQLAIPIDSVRMGFVWVYFAAVAGLLVWRPHVRHNMMRLVRSGSLRR